MATSEAQSALENCVSFRYRKNAICYHSYPQRR